MKKSLRTRNRQKARMSTRLMIVIATFSGVFLLTLGWLVYLNFNNLSKTRASGNGSEGGGIALNTTGEILTEFTWEKDPVTMATLGPDGIKSGKDAHSATGGRSSTNGLSPGPNGKDINLEIEGTELFNQEGIDISIDYRKSEPSGSFFSRGNNFNFGIDNGYLSIEYKVENAKGGSESIKEKTNYEVPDDPLYRTYRFIYSPNSGKAEIFVNSVMVWNHQGNPNAPLYWKNAGNIIIGKNMNGNGVDKAILDNLVVRSTGSVSPLAESLLNFMLEPKDGVVKVHWSSSANDKVDYFTIERSINGVDFVNVSNVKANPAKPEGEEYEYTDKTAATTSIVYYRLRQTFLNGKFVTHPLSAIKFKTEKDFAIERINPQQFEHSFDISYFLPKSGRVWMQLTDAKGKVISSETFEAPKGKNVHVFKDQVNLERGEYTLNLIFDNKKISTKVTKG
ncbi:MAG: hypothetical protein IPJ66_05865 [Bacteroidetes bacterium]|nr:hypothetical protein [Bacteroidota bacterium]MBL0139174.1 hypothetical protein [Bacteroidota bacterium]